MSTTAKKTAAPVLFNKEASQKAWNVIRAIKHPLRHQMMSIMREQGKIIVTDLFIKMRLEQSVVSQHLAILRRAGVLTTKRDGKFIYYSLNETKILEINNLIEKF